MRNLSILSTWRFVVIFFDAMLESEKMKFGQTQYVRFWAGFRANVLKFIYDKVPNHSQSQSFQIHFLFITSELQIQQNYTNDFVLFWFGAILESMKSGEIWSEINFNQKWAQAQANHRTQDCLACLSCSQCWFTTFPKSWGQLSHKILR